MIKHKEKITFIISSEVSKTSSQLKSVIDICATLMMQSNKKDDTVAMM
jgi:hypothetical protein